MGGGGEVYRGGRDLGPQNVLLNNFYKSSLNNYFINNYFKHKKVSYEEYLFHHHPRLRKRPHSKSAPKIELILVDNMFTILIYNSG